MAWRRGRCVGSVRTAALRFDFGDGGIVVSRDWPSGRITVSDPGLALYQGLLWRSGCIDDSPVNPADIIVLLNFGNLRRCVGCIALAAADAAHSGRKVSREKEPDKPDIPLARGIGDCGSRPLLWHNR